MQKDLAANDILYMVEEINDFKGGMAENYVNVQLTINGYNTYYWESERGAEIDFIIQRDGRLIPIEVKSADNTRAKSLKVYMDTYKPDYAIKLSSKTLDLRIIRRLFLYMLHFVFETNLHQYVKFLIGFSHSHNREIHNVRIGHAPIGIGEAHLTFSISGRPVLYSTNSPLPSSF